MDDEKKEKEPEQNSPKEDQAAPDEANLGEFEKEETSPEVPPADTQLTEQLTSLNDTTPAPTTAPFKKENWFKRFMHTKKGKVITIIVSLLVVAGVLFAMPTTRYGVLGYFIKRDVMLTIVDSKTNKPVSQAVVEMANLSAKTDKKGQVQLDDVPVGEYTLKVAKKYYRDTSASYAVPIFSQAPATTLKLEATGRQVVVTVTNLITKKPVKEVTVSVGEVASITDEKGEAALVLPADQQTVKAKLNATGYNQAEASVTVTEQTDANKLVMTPEGSVFYLSKATGKINVMKANLDGTAASVVVQATGSETDNDTALLAARDWKYMALFAKRKADVAGQLYLVDAKNNALKTIDEGNVDIRLIGWSDHRFLYVVTRKDKQEWEPKWQALKSYDADTGKLATLDETNATGTSYIGMESESITTPYILEGKLLYAKNVNRGAGGSHQMKPAIVAVTMSNGQLQRLKEYDFNQYATIEAKLYEPQSLFFRVNVDNGTPQFLEYEGGSLKSVTNDDNKFYNTFYPTFFVSPNSQKTFWHEPRNGKNAIFVGDKNGLNAKELAQQSDYATYGWFTDDYVLLSKNGSELFIAPADGSLDAPVKITNYHKPALQFAGYGYGYGGL